MPQAALKPGEYRVTALATGHPTAFDLQPDAEARAALARHLGIDAVKKLRFEGEIRPDGTHGWALGAKLGATVVQPCVVTLDPVTTRIDETVERLYLPADRIEPMAEEDEVEMSEDTRFEELGPVLSAWDAMVESLSLALPLYPRAGGAALGDSVHSEVGIAPLTDDDLKPFASLAALRDRLDKKS